MASSSHLKATSSSSPQRFYEYLHGLQEEFERQLDVPSTKGSSPRRFSIYLVNLKGEFELMADDINSLRKERDEYREKGVYFISPL
jgi:hypothetical protein